MKRKEACKLEEKCGLIHSMIGCEMRAHLLWILAACVRIRTFYLKG